jgi:hypothetical protein
LVDLLALRHELEDGLILEIGGIVGLILLANVDLGLERSLGGGEGHLLLGGDTLIRAPADGDEGSDLAIILALVGEIDDGESRTAVLEGAHERLPNIVLEVSAGLGLILLIGDNGALVDLEETVNPLGVVLAKLINDGQSVSSGGNTRL